MKLAHIGKIYSKADAMCCLQVSALFVFLVLQGWTTVTPYYGLLVHHRV